MYVMTDICYLPFFSKRVYQKHMQRTPLDRKKNPNNIIIDRWYYGWRFAVKLPWSWDNFLHFLYCCDNPEPCCKESILGQYLHWRRLNIDRSSMVPHSQVIQSSTISRLLVTHRSLWWINARLSTHSCSSYKNIALGKQVCLRKWC